MKNANLKKVLSPIIIGISGGTASGKTSVCKKILESFANEKKSCYHLSRLFL